MTLVLNPAGVISPSTPQAFPLSLPYMQDPAQWVNGNAPGLYYASPAAVGNTADTNEDILQTFSLVPNLLNFNGKALRIKAWGITANNADTKALRIYHGTTVFNFALNTSTASPWLAEFILQRISATVQYAVGTVLHGTTLIAPQQTTTGADTLTGALVAKVTGQASAANANDIVCSAALLELIQ